ncbi:hypothetical protein JCM9140_4666 [Halalkalibacter wakoensis JCM 9140]|uniref:Uncharacterized protein n=1 Tax=Halalkalibacter wakoensis JCM 9140 TaxID=1236970 RepID=W4Q8S7_9BACI|nr:competence type IV pilus minor pilin ComGG [Halalkalibacter wakoensis]GAE28441.1 hypothetical protein JCM9140_4666 [Halalkalibacter wakoensis JCM 9140]
MKGESGFIFPVTLVMCAIIMHVLLYQVNVYMLEKRSMYEQEKLMMTESIIRVGITEFLRNDYEPITNQKIVFPYDEGTVTLLIEDYSQGISRISILATLKTGQERRAGFRFDWNEKTVEDYWEVSKRVTAILHYRIYGFWKNNHWTSIS